MEKRQLTEQEKQEIIRRHGNICFVTGHEIPEGEKPEFHHIIPYSEYGDTITDNEAPVCKEHHKHIGTLSIQEYRDKLDLESFFSDAEHRKLDDVLAKKIGQFGKKVVYEESSDNKNITITFFNGNKVIFPLNICPATKEKSFYASVPCDCIKNDLELQPRDLMPKKMWELYTHLMINTQLAGSVCRLQEGQILLFDGQHKAAAQVWAGRRNIECKIYIEPNKNRLKETNLTAHEKLRQMPFYTSTLIRKYNDIFRDDWEEYISQTGEKSEDGFVRYLIEFKNKKKADTQKQIKYALINDILFSDKPKNKITEFIAEENHTRKNPLTHSSLNRTFFSEFLVTKPIKESLEGSEDLRTKEKNNMVRLFNIVAEETLIGHWNPEANNAGHKKAERIYLAGAIRAWVPLLKDVVAQVLRIYDSDQKETIFFGEISEDNFELIRGRVRRLFSHKIWTDPNIEISTRLKINEPKISKAFLRENGLDVGWVLGSTN
jgi:hypothetical protein